MIVSRPITSTLISFILFLAISFVLTGMSLSRILSDPHPPWYAYLVVITLGPVAIFILFKMLIGYKILSLGNNAISVRYPVLGRTKAYPLEQVEYWMEAQVKTGKNSTFKELEIRFTDRRSVRLGHREYSDYSKIVSYLEKKVGKKKQ